MSVTELTGRQMSIVIDAKSKFGVLDKKTNKWLNPADKKLIDAFKVGGEYVVEMVENKGKDGKVYLNIGKIVSGKDSPTLSPEAKKVFGKSSSAPADINKDQRILIQGLTQAVLQSPLMTFAKKDHELAYVEKLVTELAALVKKLAA